MQRALILLASLFFLNKSLIAADFNESIVYAVLHGETRRAKKLVADPIKTFQGLVNKRNYVHDQQARLWVLDNYAEHFSAWLEQPENLLAQRELLRKLTKKMDIESIRKLFELGADPHGVYPNGETDLVRAIRISSEVARLYLEAGADPNQEMEDFPMALFVAIDHCPCLIDDLIEKYGANPQISIDGNSALFLLLCEGHSATARKLIEQDRVDVDNKSTHRIMRSKNFDWFNLLLTKGASEPTLLRACIHANWNDALVYMIQKGADCSDPELLELANCRSKKCAATLIYSGATLTVTNALSSDSLPLARRRYLSKEDKKLGNFTIELSDTPLINVALMLAPYLTLKDIAALRRTCRKMNIRTFHNLQFRKMVIKPWRSFFRTLSDEDLDAELKSMDGFVSLLAMIEQLKIKV